MTARSSAAAVIVGALVATSVVIVSLSYHPGPTVVQFNGVSLHTTYFGNSSGAFGPADQNACNETYLAGWNGPDMLPKCPQSLVGGTSYNLWFFTTGNPGKWPGLWINMTVSGPFYFEVNPQNYGYIPTTISNVTGLFEGGGHFLYDGGQYSGWDLLFTFPTNFASPVGGLWLSANLTVEPTNQTMV